MELSLLQLFGLLVLAPFGLIETGNFIKAVAGKCSFSLTDAIVLIGCVLGVLAILGVLH